MLGYSLYQEYLTICHAVHKHHHCLIFPPIGEESSMWLLIHTPNPLLVIRNCLNSGRSTFGIQNVLFWPAIQKTSNLPLLALYELNPAVTGRFSSHDDVIKWKHFPRYWPFVREIHRSPVNFPHKGQWHGALMFSLICARMNGWVNYRNCNWFLGVVRMNFGKESPCE